VEPRGLYPRAGAESSIDSIAFVNSYMQEHHGGQGAALGFSTCFALHALLARAYNLV
jgi:hypothetical protein